MRLQLLQNVRALAVNLTTPLSGAGGTEPYTYAVLPGGAGGTVTANGLYKAPNNNGTDIIEVTDATGAKAQATVDVCTAVELLADIIKRELNLDRDQVYLQDSKIQIPPDNRIYVALGILTCKVYGNSAKVGDDGYEVQSTNFNATISIDIFSKSTEARERKEEIVLALNSQYSRQQQEMNSFYVAKHPGGFINLSAIEGSAIPHRFNISVSIHYCVTKTRGVAYYENFEDASIVAEP